MASNHTDGNMEIPMEVGYICLPISVLIFGSSLIPIKTYDVGDGMFFQWVRVAGVWIIGIIIQGARQNPPFHFLPVIGGVLWATGNMCMVPILKTIGMSLGMLIWSSVNMLLGWGGGRFGWFDIKKEVPGLLALNYIGVVLSFLRGPIMLFVNNTGPTRPTVEEDSEGRDFQPTGSITLNEDIADNLIIPEETPEFWDQFSPIKKKIIGCGLAVLTGLCYGFTYTPMMYLVHIEKDKDGIDYTFSQVTGAFLASTVYFLIYCIIMRNKPRLMIAAAILPTFCSGALWSVGQLGWLVANTTVGEEVSFPVLTSGPAVVGCLWGILLFKEVRGRKNLVLVLAAIVVTIAGSLCVALSRPGQPT